MEFKSCICDKDGNMILHCTDDKRSEVIKRRKNLIAMYFINCSSSSIGFTRGNKYLSNVKINLLFRWFARNIQKVND